MICQHRILTKRTDFDICTFMNTISVSVTDFRDNLADYLNAVKFEKRKIIVIKNRSIMAEVSPAVSIEERKKRLLSYAGIWKDLPVEKMEREIIRARRQSAKELSRLVSP